MSVPSVGRARGRRDEREQLRLKVRLLALWEGAEGSAQEDRESMDASPRGVLNVRAASGRQDSGVDEVVEGGSQIVERSGCVGSLIGRGMLGGRERGLEEAWLLTREREIGLADRAKPEPGACRRVWPRTYLAYAIGHSLRELADRFVADGREERVTVGEMPIGGIGDDPDHASHLAKHDGVRAAGSRQLETGLNERGPNRATSTRSAPPGQIALLPASTAPPIACHLTAL
jgi:hypothetical protein